MRRRAPHGFTIIELLISLTILGVILGSLFGIILRAQQQYVRQRNAAQTDEALRAGELVITRLLRGALADPMRTGNALLDPDPNNDAIFSDLRVKSDFNTVDGVFTGPLEDVRLWTANDTLYVRWQAADVTGAPLVYPIRQMRFYYYDRHDNPLTTKADVDSATRAKILLTSPRAPGSTELAARELWVYLRNRR